jgi:hypothetical protein
MTNDHRQRTTDGQTRFPPFFIQWHPLFDRYPTVYARFSPFSRFMKFRARNIFFGEKLPKETLNSRQCEKIGWETS